MAAKNVVTFNRRKGLPFDFLDSRDYAAIDRAKQAVRALADELEAQAVGTGKTPALDAFLANLQRVTERVRLNAVLAFKESAGLHATWTADRAASLGGAAGGKPRPARVEAAIVFQVPPLDLAVDNTFDKRFVKLLLLFMGCTRKRTNGEGEAFLEPIESPSEIVQHAQWLSNAIRVATLLSEAVATSSGPVDRLRSEPLDAVAAALTSALGRLDAPYAEAESVDAIDVRDTMIKKLVEEAGRGFKLARGNVKEYEYLPLHKNPLVQALQAHNADPPGALTALAVAIAERNRNAPEVVDRYTSIANRIALEMTARWKPYPSPAKEKRLDSLKDATNAPFSRFLESLVALEKRDELVALAQTRYFQERGYRIGVRGQPKMGEILGALYRALNNPPSAGALNNPPSEEDEWKPSEQPRRRPGRPRKQPQDAEDALFQSVPLGVSYVAEARLDATGNTDASVADDILRESLVVSFWDEVNKARGQKAPSKQARNKRAADDDSADKAAAGDSFSDKIATNLKRGARLQSIIERCEAILDTAAGEKEGTASATDGPAEDAAQVPVPTFPEAKGRGHVHPDDAGYFKLQLRGQATAAGLVARRRWWWAYMFVTLVRVDMAGRRGPRVFRHRTYLEVAEFLDDPVAFASDERRHWTATGPPGTGKTSFLRLLGVLYHLLGLYPLASIDDRQITVLQMRDLISGYEGQSALRTAEVFVNGLGTFLPIDEAYALVPVKRDEAVSPYSQQVIDTLLTVLNDARSLMGTALVGYSSGVLDRLLRTNDGLQRRFPRSFNIPEYTAENIVSVLLEALRIKDRNAWADDLGSKTNKPALVGFFGFITGTTKTFKHDGITYSRDVLVQQRYDEGKEEYDARVATITSRGQVGNLFAHENASGALDVATLLVRDKARTTVTVTDVINATRQLLLQRNLIEISDEERALQQKEMERRKDMSTDDE